MQIARCSMAEGVLAFTRTREASIGRDCERNGLTGVDCACAPAAFKATLILLLCGSSRGHE
ncbi:hypothetical protein ELH40_00400 [Rhizobium ruizarguesonis]|uniref:Uncharacterized protein n=1 Tax=Rhizobium ruizarguesonis TaxID=2081791 RepID=A0AB38I0B0_9HYPH|nr:hypothetical protein [Rhizobium leguminosarum bv. viciae]TBC13496.1 hypothetical protein ELH40_00400 [Rhizobium ruizarguesonis]